MRKELTFQETMLKFIHSGLSVGVPPNRHTCSEWDKLISLEDRVNKILGIVNRKNRSAGSMLFFVMYDISSNMVRKQVVKYLEKKGCLRVQKSIFLADLDAYVYNEIKNDLTEVQAAYDNNDSILVLPFSVDYLKSMKIIGKQIELDVILHNRSTLFF